MPKKYLSTTARTTLESQDKLGKNESFEARTRGALGPYWTLVDLCNMDLDDPVVRKFIEDAIPKHQEENGHMENLLELLKHSEDDREESVDLMKELIEAWGSLPEGHFQPNQISAWLVHEMKPVIDKFRVKLDLKTEADG